MKRVMSESRVVPAELSRRYVKRWATPPLLRAPNGCFARRRRFGGLRLVANLLEGGLVGHNDLDPPAGVPPDRHLDAQEPR